MLSANFRVIGIGRAYNGNSSYGWYWTTDFGGYVDQVINPNSTPTIASFTANPSTITPGQPTTLSWSVSGASESVEKPNFLKKHSGSKHFSGNFLAKDYFKFGSNKYFVRS
jgi:hypothetical protein